MSAELVAGGVNPRSISIPIFTDEESAELERVMGNIQAFIREQVASSKESFPHGGAHFRETRELLLKMA